MSASSNAGSDTHESSIGVVLGHAYTLIGACKVKG